MKMDEITYEVGLNIGIEMVKEEVTKPDYFMYICFTIIITELCFTLYEEIEMRMHFLF